MLFQHRLFTDVTQHLESLNDPIQTVLKVLIKHVSFTEYLKDYLEENCTLRVDNCYRL